jgi:hypothetical protein
MRRRERKRGSKGGRKREGEKNEKEKRRRCSL